ncbi:hypothetical protein [Ranid herpesvirus 3]|uniref:Uncharacterized protein n=1 Tax=Ranid herpesvirus 3 TaxID=1987509 RepID=A0A1X9T595_9VIRU|nr:hypothetical protein [Ranid herpesvirus 3]ARR28867.1 hypothetical protein [Ranid herpesvirus 3]
MSKTICEGFRVIHVSDAATPQALYGIFWGADKYRFIARVIWREPAAVDTILIPGVHFDAIDPIGPLTDLMPYERVNYYGRICSSRRAGQLIETIFAANPRRMESFREAECLNENILNRCLEENVPICYHFSIFRMIYEGRSFEEALAHKNSCAGFSFNQPVPYTAPSLGSPLETFQSVVKKKVNDKTPIMAAINSSEHISRNQWGYTPGFFKRVSMQTFVDFNKTNKMADGRGAAFSILLDYANGKIQDDDERTALLGLPEPPFDSKNLSLLSEDGIDKRPTHYILCDRVGLTKEWKRRSEVGEECCFNEIYVPDRPTTLLVLDIDLQSKAAFTALSAPFAEKALRCASVGFANALNSLSYTRGLTFRDVGAIHLFHRPDPNKLSARIVWMLPLELCGELRLGASVVNEFARRLKTTSCPLSQVVIRSDKLLGYLDPISSVWEWFGGDRNGTQSIECGLDIATLHYKKSVRLPLCDKPGCGRIIYISSINSKTLKDPTPCMFISNLFIDRERVSLQSKLHILQGPEPLKEHSYEPICDPDLKIVKERLALTFNVPESTLHFRGYFIRCTERLMCHIHNRVHKNATQFFTFNRPITPDTVNQKCFHHNFKTAFARLTWKNGSYQPSD